MSVKSMGRVGYVLRWIPSGTAGVCQLGVRAHTLESRSGHLPNAAQRARPVASDPMYRKLLVALFPESAHTTFCMAPWALCGSLRQQ